MKYIAILAYEKWCVITINLYHGNEAWNAVVCQTWTLADFLASHMISGKVFFKKKVSTQTSTALLYKIEIQSKEILQLKMICFELCCKALVMSVCLQSKLFI